ncbi:MULTISPECIES: GNAT family N-acetyltransferase [Halobacterium]|uniref:GNAT family N-acetyltransferase n=1 Tax=Halobacterium TaxID=2239 RepID=UPI00073E51DC|nr:MULTISPECIES: GNAT family N-acetyltransferase [Halobacterium]MCG1002511.1 GNAT family N-acetyltransferase [Halobacterium noricense]
MPPDGRETGASCDAWDNSHCEGTRFCQPRCPRVVDDDGRALVVRRLADGDADRLLDMYAEMSTESTTLGLPPRTRERTARWLDGLDADGLNLVAVDDGRAVGHVAAAPLDDPDPRLVVFVRPGHRDRGLGTELLRQLVAYAADSGCESLLLTVDADNERAVHVYDNLGFDVVERLRAELTMEIVLDGPLVERAQAPPAERSDHG